jgi:biotin transport system substrate-specific component
MGQENGVRTALRFAAGVVALSAVVAVASRVALPLGFTPVPLSLGPLAVLAIGLLAGPRMAGSAVLLYLGYGAMGLPVFASGPLGLAHLMGPTGGYLLAWPLAAVLAGALARLGRRSFAGNLAAAAAASLVVLGLGALWLTVSLHLTAGQAFMLGVAPFLPGDVLKVAAAAGVASGWNRATRTNR